jgi:hypothetical protein
MTRKHVRRGLIWAGIGVGGVGMLLGILSFFGVLSYVDSLRELEVGRGAIHLNWHRTARTVPGAAGAPVPARTTAVTTAPQQVTIQSGGGGTVNVSARAEQELAAAQRRLATAQEQLEEYRTREVLAAARARGSAPATPTAARELTLAQDELAALQQVLASSESRLGPGHRDLERTRAMLMEKASHLLTLGSDPAAEPLESFREQLERRVAEAQTAVEQSQLAQRAAAQRLQVAAQARQQVIARAAPPPRVPRPREVKFAPVPADRGWLWLPVFRSPDPAATAGRLVLPWWILALVGAWCGYLLLPSDVAPGFCPRCRFDLRRTPELPDRPGRVRCPECGRIAPARQAGRDEPPPA